MAWSQLLDYLPLVLIFDLKENTQLDAAMITQLMEQLKVSILIKPKHKQNVKSIVVRGCEKDSRLLFQVRKEILGLDESEVPICCDNHGLSIFTKIVQSFTPAGPASKPDDSLLQALNQLASLNPNAAQCIAAAIFAGKNDHGGQQVNPMMLSSLVSNQPTQSAPISSMASGSSLGRYNPLTPSSTPCPSSPDSRSMSEQGSPRLATTSFFPHIPLVPQKAGSLGQKVPITYNAPDKDGITSQWQKDKVEAWEAILGGADPNKPRTPNPAYCNKFFSQTHPSGFLSRNLEWSKPLDKIPEFFPSGFRSKSADQNARSADFSSTWAPGSNHSIESVLSTLFGRQHWNLEALLAASDLEKFVPLFDQHKVDLSIFLTLNQSDLQSLGIPFAPRQKMLSIINELNRLLSSQDQEPTSPLPEYPTSSRSSIPPPPGMSLPDLISSQTNFNPTPGAGRQYQKMP